jgi:hypothetical protein
LNGHAIQESGVIILKRLFLILLCLLPVAVRAPAAVVKSPGTGYESRLAVPFGLLDSLGNYVTANPDHDSLEIVIWGMGGLCYYGRMVIADSRIHDTVINGRAWYCFMENLENVDSSGSPGLYSFDLRVFDSTYQWWSPAGAGILNVSEYGIAEELQEIAAVLDSLESQDDWVARETSLFDAISTPVVIRDTTMTGREIASMPESWSGGDSLAFQGAMGSPEVIAEAVWGADSSQIDTSRIGHWLTGNLAAECAGSGVYSYTLVAYDSSVQEPVPGVNLVVRNAAQTAAIAAGTTDMSGEISFNLDSDTYIAVAFSPGYTFGSFDSIAVGGPGVDTVMGCRFDPGPASAPDLCRLYGFLYDIGGSPERDAVVAASLPAGAARTGNTLVSPFEVSAVTDSTGYFFLDLIPGPRLTPDTLKYEISISLDDGTVLRERVFIPDAENYLLSW